MQRNTKLQDIVVWYLIVSIPDLCTLTYFHLCCAKLIKTVFRPPLPVVDDDTDTEKHDKTVNKLGIFFPKPEKMIRTMPTLKSNSMSDLELTLQQAKSLPSESSTRLAKVSLYDFAGQYIFHASHPTFLSPQATYILVFNLNKLIEMKGKTKKMDQYFHEDEEQYYGDCRGHGTLGDKESIFFWLNVIYLFAVLNRTSNPK